VKRLITVQRAMIIHVAMAPPVGSLDPSEISPATALPDFEVIWRAHLVAYLYYLGNAAPGVVLRIS